MWIMGQHIQMDGEPARGQVHVVGGAEHRRAQELSLSCHWSWERGWEGLNDIYYGPRKRNQESGSLQWPILTTPYEPEVPELRIGKWGSRIYLRLMAGVTGLLARLPYVGKKRS